VAREVWTQGPFEHGGFRFPRMGRPPAGRVRVVGVAILFLLLLLTSYYQVEAGGGGVVQRFGRFVRDRLGHLAPFQDRDRDQVPVQRSSI
jgi:regulator of protease activity HflC (stomatin/prohibitin superfamily)